MKAKTIKQLLDDVDAMVRELFDASGHWSVVANTGDTSLTELQRRADYIMGIPDDILDIANDIDRYLANYLLIEPYRKGVHRRMTRLHKLVSEKIQP